MDTASPTKNLISAFQRTRRKAISETQTGPTRTFSGGGGGGVRGGDPMRTSCFRKQRPPQRQRKFIHAYRCNSVYIGTWLSLFLAFSSNVPKIFRNVGSSFNEATLLFRLKHGTAFG